MDPGLEDQLLACERRLGIRLCIIDHHGSLHHRRGTLLSARWQSHRSAPVCDIGFGPRCVQHCRDQVNVRLERKPAPFVTTCWKGLREIAVPVRWQGHHLATLYAGTWRQASLPAAGAGLPQAWTSHWRNLPLWNEAAVEGLREVLLLLCEGLTQRLIQAMPVGDLAAIHGDRRARIRQFLHLHGHMPVTIADLARTLHLSPSRCAATVREHFGESFRLLLRHHRLEKSCSLLRMSDDRIADIAERVGFEDPLYFSRCFRRQIGCSPRDYRRSGVRPGRQQTRAGRKTRH